MKYAEALWLLLQTAPSQSDINRAECLMDTFCAEFAALYGKIYDTWNTLCQLNFILQLIIIITQVNDTAQPTYTYFVTLLILFAIWDPCGRIPHSHLRMQTDGLLSCLMEHGIHQKRFNCMHALILCAIYHDCFGNRL